MRALMIVQLVDEHGGLGTFKMGCIRALAGDTRVRLVANTAQGLEHFDWETLVQQTRQALEPICTS